MIFRQFFDSVSSTYSYLIANQTTREALLIDPVKEKTALYVQYLQQLELKLLVATDTHTHADHTTALGDLREQTGCLTLMGEQSGAECVSARFKDGERITIQGLDIRALYTPGHTQDSYSFVMPDRVFTGDTLLIRSTGRTDFQGGDPEQSYQSIQRLWALPDQCQVYPAHDYQGCTVSTIGEEKRFNPRLAQKTAAQYVEIMQNLHLPNPKMMDVAIPANLRCGKTE